jgi:MFS family permease
MASESSPPKVESARGFAALRHRDFALCIGSKLLVFGSQHMVMLAVGYQIYDLTGSALALAYINLVMICPTFLFAFVTGYACDRFDRRTILICGFATMAISGSALCWLTLIGEATSGWVYVALALASGARAFHNPATNSITPTLVPKSVFPNAVAWSTLTSKMAQIGGPAIGGIIYLFGPEVVYATAAVCFTIGTIGVSLIRPRGASAPDKPFTGGALIAGLSFVLKKKVLRGAVLLDLCVVLTSSVVAVLPIIAKDVLDVGPAGAGLLRSAMAMGGILAATVMTGLPITARAGLIMFASDTLLALSAISIGLSVWFPLSLVTMFMMGVGEMVSLTIRHTLFQIGTPNEMRGRVAAVSMVAGNTGSELGGFRAGLVASFIGIVPSIVVGGVVGLAVVGIGWKLFPELARVERLDETT